MSWLVFFKMGAKITAAPAAGGLGLGIGFDLVAAMSVSWLPLAADYARFGRRTRPAGRGAFLGYFLVSAWMYTLGLAAALATGSATPEAMILGLMAESGWVIPALAVVVLSTFTTTFLDVYSTGVSTLNLPINLGERTATAVAGVLGTILALSFPAAAYEPFLLYIGSFFCPLFGLVLADYFIVRRGSFGGAKMDQVPGLNLQGLLAWAVGFVLYRLALNYGWPMGASLPSFVGAGLLYVIIARRKA